MRVGADREKGGVAERDLPGVTHEQIQAEGRDHEQRQRRQHVEREALGDEERVDQERGDQQPRQRARPRTFEQSQVLAVVALEIQLMRAPGYTAVRVPCKGRGMLYCLRHGCAADHQANEHSAAAAGAARVKSAGSARDRRADPDQHFFRASEPLRRHGRASAKEARTLARAVMARLREGRACGRCGAGRARREARRAGRIDQRKSCRVADERSRDPGSGRRDVRHVHDQRGRTGRLHPPPQRNAGLDRRERRAARQGARSPKRLPGARQDCRGRRQGIEALRSSGGDVLEGLHALGEERAKDHSPRSSDGKLRSIPTTWRSWFIPPGPPARRRA